MFKRICRFLAFAISMAGVVAAVSEWLERFREKNTACGPYEAYLKRPLDCMVSIAAFLVLSPVMAVVALLVRIKLGSPILFTQERPGKNEKIFKLYKFRTMTDERDSDGKLLPDEIRLTEFGKMLRSTSLDELPELINIIKGDMAVVGPRPQLVRDMVFMSEKQRTRHDVRPGLTGLAQIKGRNSITWKEKLDWDLKYIQRVTFWDDLKIIFATIATVFEKSGITDGENATALDYGDVLLKDGKVTKPQYDALQAYAKNLIAEYERKSK